MPATKASAKTLDELVEVLKLAAETKKQLEAEGYKDVDDVVLLAKSSDFPANLKFIALGRDRTILEAFIKEKSAPAPSEIPANDASTVKREATPAAVVQQGPIQTAAAAPAPSVAPASVISTVTPPAVLASLLPLITEGMKLYRGSNTGTNTGMTSGGGAPGAGGLTGTTVGGAGLTGSSLGGGVASHAGNSLTAGQMLRHGQVVQSPSGRYQLIMQQDGNLVLYRMPERQPVWASNTCGQPVTHCIMQQDGNLVLYDAAERPYWASNSNGNPGACMTLQDDGNFFVHVGSSEFFCSQSAGH